MAVDKTSTVEEVSLPKPNDHGLVMTAPTWEEIQSVLLDEGSSVKARYRVLFHARKGAPSMSEASELLLQTLPFQKDSVLLRHEFAYVLGQLEEKAATSTLRQILHDEEEDCIVRHEAAEALAALGEMELVDELDTLAQQTTSVPLRHTCELAVDGLRKKALEGEAVPICMCQYTSVDPASGLLGATDADVPAAAAALLNESLPLFERYEGLFTLRNVGGAASIEALAKALLNDTSSAVLRHEVAFVLAQMEDEASVVALTASLARLDEHAMVRHEAAIALGTIGTLEADEVLRKYVNDFDQLVGESCEVALQTSAYWRAWEEIEARILADR
jgi:deoxyhypusine monooxygenase